MAERRITVYLQEPTDDEYAQVANGVWTALRAMNIKFEVRLDRASATDGANEAWRENYAEVPEWGAGDVEEP